MITVELWAMYEDFFAVLVPEKIGVSWSNQTAGIGCQHPELEGYLIPLPWHFMHAATKRGVDPIENRGAIDRGEYDPAAVQAFLDWSDGAYFEPLSAEEAKALGQAFHEAWVPVRVVREERDLPEHLRHLAGRAVILTYCNSD